MLYIYFWCHVYFYKDVQTSMEAISSCNIMCTLVGNSRRLLRGKSRKIKDEKDGSEHVPCWGSMTARAREENKKSA